MGKGPGEITVRIVNGLKEITRTFEDGSFETTYEHSEEGVEKWNNVNNDELATKNAKALRPDEAPTEVIKTEELDITTETKKYESDKFEEQAEEQQFPSSSKEYKDEKNKPTITEKIVDGRKEIRYEYPDGRSQTEYEEIFFKPEEKNKMKPASKGPGRLHGTDTRYITPEVAMSWRIVDGQKEITTRHKDGRVDITYEEWDGCLPDGTPCK